MKISSPQRIKGEDFEQEDRKLAEQIGAATNSFGEEIYNALNKNLSIDDNLNQFRKTIKVNVNASGIPSSKLQVRNELKTRITGSTVIRAIFNDNITSHPFMFFIEDNGLIQITKITGLTAGEDFQLVVLFIGQ